MLIRFIVENVLSFGSQKEFTTIPNNRLKTLQHHKYNFNGFNVLKTSSIYGANGAGKSNLINALDLLQRLVVKDSIPFALEDTQFKFTPNKKQTLAVEFIQEDKAFYYGIEFINNLIITEELYLSGLGKKDDELVYERKTNTDGTRIMFFDEFEKDEKNQMLKTILIEEFVKPNETILQLLSKRDAKLLDDTKIAYRWFDETLQIISTDSKPISLALQIEKQTGFKKYAEDVMCSFNLGISSLSVEKVEIVEYFGKDNEIERDKIITQLKNHPNLILKMFNNQGEDLIVYKENNTNWVAKLKIEHRGGEKSVLFNLSEESDGTRRLLDFLPAFRILLSKNKVFFIDEIERSIHPLLIKELIKKFSLDTETKGQLFFTTHESNLLDQEIFRQDEIWFVEKDETASSDLYSLNDFGEHKTIDIRKGYLNGRYGSIPFLANLHDLNWHKNDPN